MHRNAATSIDAETAEMVSRNDPGRPARVPPSQEERNVGAEPGGRCKGYRDPKSNAPPKMRAIPTTMHPMMTAAVTHHRTVRPRNVRALPCQPWARWDRRSLMMAPVPASCDDGAGTGDGSR
jgi:hypothetical protein